MEKFIDNKAFARVVKRIRPIIDQFDWCLIGGRAVEVHANPPQTPDLDFLVKYGPKDMRGIIEAMQNESFVLTKRLSDRDFVPILFFEDTIERDGEKWVEIDIIGAFEDVQLWALERATNRRVNGVAMPVAQAEDIVILKADAAVSGGRPVDKRARDKAAIIAINENVDLDVDYIETILSQGMADRADEKRLLIKLGVL